MNRLARTVVSVFVFASSVALNSAKDRLNIFIWSEYLPNDVVAEFQKRFDCDVVVDNYESSEAMISKIQAGGSDLYDIVVPSDEFMPILTSQGLVAQLDHGQLPNLKNLEERFLSPPYDPGNKFSVPYQWGTTGILIRKKPGEHLEESWSLFFDPKKQPGSIVLLDSPTDLIRAALKYKGFDFNSVDPKELKAVRDLLVETKKRSVGFANSVAAQKSVLGKSARASITYSGAGAEAAANDPELTYFVPREGSVIWVDNLVILKKAPHPQIAHKFINYVLEPKVGARISNTYFNAAPNREAKKFIRPELLTNTMIYPTEETMRRLEYAKHLGRNSRLHDQLWTSVKSN